MQAVAHLNGITLVSVAQHVWSLYNVTTSFFVHVAGFTDVSAGISLS